MSPLQIRRPGTAAVQAGLWAQVRAVSFDLGGTLVITEAHPTTGQVAQVLGITLDQARALMESGAKRCETTPAKLAVELADQAQRPELTAPLHAVLNAARERAASPQPFPDAVPLLEHLRERGFALVAMTNSLGSSIPLLEPELFGLLDAVFYSARTGHCKPEPEAFNAVQQALGLAPHQLLHVGDSARADVQGAVAAGWHAAYLHRPSDPRLPAPTAPEVVRLSTLASLPRLLPTLR